MRPDADRAPSRLCQEPVGVAIACDVRCQLRLPPGTVGGRLRPVNGAAVPEAPVDEDRHLQAREDEVRAPTASRQRRHVDPVAKPLRVQRSAQGQLGRCVAAAGALHASPDGRSGRRRGAHGCSGSAQSGLTIPVAPAYMRTKLATCPSTLAVVGGGGEAVAPVALVVAGPARRQLAAGPQAVGRVEHLGHQRDRAELRPSARRSGQCPPVPAARGKQATAAASSRSSARRPITPNPWLARCPAMSSRNSGGATLSPPRQRRW